ncbi:ABC transporter permease [Tsukamurella sp. 8F]|uniref:ABC transporter permease n=1 Tax=unclassified Tsukamurella TaxID=2633480 RepID=UPI0023B88DA1|nr:MULTISPECIES: ABC transporter permease [unclassified Tsukamurella]MDF0528966.1 ABC transporter permease [Tsukamurella sp. 8J]MDF0587339.1 ABC transporter permease [Tsukamurella sp. 8F]
MTSIATDEGTIARDSAPTSASIARTRVRIWMRRMPVALWGYGALGLALVALGIVGPYLVSDPTIGQLSERMQGIGASGHPLGTDGLGRDVLDRLVAGARPSMTAALVPVIIAGILGTVLGMAAGMSGRGIHSAIMRTLDVFYAFPAVLLAIAIATALGAGTTSTVIALSIVLIPPVARIAETETLRLAGMDFMESAQVSGASRIAIAYRQVLPNVAPALLVYCTSLVGLALVFAGGLSFLGLGVAPPKPEWGQMVGDQRQYLFSHPAAALIPACVIFAASFVFNMLGDALSDALDVRRRIR